MRRLNATSAAALTPLRDALVAPVLPSAPVAADPAQERDGLHREREAVFAEAKRDGLAAGRQEVEAEIAKRTDEIAKSLRDEHAGAVAALQAERDALRTLARRLDDAVQAHRRECEEAAVEGAYAALLQVLGRRSVENSLMQHLCEHVLERQGRGPLTLRLAPSDCAHVGLPDEIRIVPDATLAPGACVVESPRGGVDTGLDVRLAALRDAFLEALTVHRGQP